MHTFQGAMDQKLKKTKKLYFLEYFSADARWPGGKMSKPDSPNIG